LHISTQIAQHRLLQRRLVLWLVFLIIHVREQANFRGREVEEDLIEDVFRRPGAERGVSICVRVRKGEPSQKKNERLTPTRQPP
jgi:hypothetical protein